VSVAREDPRLLDDEARDAVDDRLGQPGAEPGVAGVAGGAGFCRVDDPQVREGDERDGGDGDDRAIIEAASFRSSS
jgi:hypothetical protein